MLDFIFQKIGGSYAKTVNCLLCKYVIQAFTYTAWE